VDPCYHGEQDIDNLVVSDGGSHSGGGESRMRSRHPAMTSRKHLPTSVGVSPVQLYLHLCGGFSYPAGPIGYPGGPCLANTSPLRWGFLQKRIPISLSLSRNHLPTSVGVSRPPPTNIQPALAKHTPHAWGFLLELHHPPTPVGVSRSD